MRSMILSFPTVDTYRPGYPQYSALVASHPSFYIFRRFLRSRVRLLLLKQDEIALLEDHLDRVDREETRELFLGSARRDRNSERARVITKMEAAVENYGRLFSIRIRYWLRQDLLSSDKLLERTQKLLAREVPRQDDTLNLQNWVDNTSCLAEKETRYLLQYEDLTTLYSPGDDALARLNPAIEAFLRALYRLLKKVSGLKLSSLIYGRLTPQKAAERNF